MRHRLEVGPPRDDEVAEVLLGGGRHQNRVCSPGHRSRRSRPARGTPVAEPAPVGVTAHEAEVRRVVGVDDVDDRDAAGTGPGHLRDRVGVGRGREQLHAGGAGGDDEEAAHPGAGVVEPQHDRLVERGVGGQHRRRLEVEPVHPAAAVVDDPHRADDGPVGRRRAQHPHPAVAALRGDGGGVDDAPADLGVGDDLGAHRVDRLPERGRDEPAWSPRRSRRARRCRSGRPRSGPCPATGPSNPAQRTRKAGPGSAAQRVAPMPAVSGIDAQQRSMVPARVGRTVGEYGAPVTVGRASTSEQGAGGGRQGEGDGALAAGDERALQLHLLQGARVLARRPLPGLEDDVLGARVEGRRDDERAGPSTSSAHSRRPPPLARLMTSPCTRGVGGEAAASAPSATRSPSWGRRRRAARPGGRRSGGGTAGGGRAAGDGEPPPTAPAATAAAPPATTERRRTDRGAPRRGRRGRVGRPGRRAGARRRRRGRRRAPSPRGRGRPRPGPRRGRP